MSMTLLVLVVVLGAEPLKEVTVMGLSLRAPAGWEQTRPDENSAEWAAPGDSARFAVFASPLDSPLPAKGCLKKLLDAVGKDGFTELVIAGAPAAKKVTTDYVGEGEEAKIDANRVTTTTVLGCDGRLKWVLTFSARTSLGPRLGPVLQRVLASVAYTGKGT